MALSLNRVGERRADLAYRQFRAAAAVFAHGVIHRPAGRLVVVLALIVAEAPHAQNRKRGR